MIVSHHHRFIFAAVPKTGTHSVRQALREQMGDDDVEQVGLFVNRRFPWGDLAAIQHGHLSLRQVRPYLGEDAFGGYFKFAFVRNPFDRFVSYCAFMLRGGDLFQQRPREVMHHLLFREPPEHHILFRPQASLLLGEDGRTLLTDAIGRVEDMQGSYDAICARIGIPSRPLGRVNGSRHGDYRRYYDRALIDGVAARYAQDLDLFGYTFEGMG
ncbi:sulfotransferase family 2 domain-containing protein [Novosphingobium album (ex Liu et al. 2023)]|uniref:Sulfotransferase family 2 domain-containing protein n=1 Tax=Novosphingobium album (ex Liu et al. 2023) TaxID=3031130 RepID=A0ABT5WLS6_9SPHN|nr:sulfotransferase family 2 domain-containing protein [Novosphingobium album (ex Liu et al. 2023)]MDE8651007.1 sulfotransferase family 2 domain-containing protein [Novosphingobium album (ex Liu et al. 2023)]